MYHQYANPLFNPYYSSAYGLPSPFEFYGAPQRDPRFVAPAEAQARYNMGQSQLNLMQSQINMERYNLARDVQPLVIPRPLPPGSVSPIMYKPVPVVYEGDRVILGGGREFPLPTGVDELMTQQRLSDLMTGADKK